MRAMPTAVVTGGAGFLGSHLCDYLLEQDHRVICVDNLETGSLENIEHLRDGAFSFVHQDVVDGIWIDEPVDFVYHLASPASPIDYLRLPLQTLKVGSHGTHNALGLAKWKRARFLISSTSEVYGDPKVHPQPEDYWGNVNPVGPRSCYDEGKRCAETLFFDYRRQHHMPVKVCRIFNTYGPRMHPNDGRVVSSFIVQALTGREITVFGEGLQTRSFCYFDDLIGGFLAFMATPADVVGPINLGNPDEFTIIDLARKVIDLTGSASKVVHRPLPHDDPKQRRPDIARAQEVLGWAPQVPLEDGLKRTIAYFD